MKRNLVKCALLYAGAAALAAGMAFGQAPLRARPARAAILARSFKGLDLTDAQKQQAKGFLKDGRAASAPLKQQIQQNRQDLEAAVKANDTTKIQALTQTQGQLQGQAAAIRSTSLAKVYSILTPDQRAKQEQREQKLKQRAGQVN